LSLGAGNVQGWGFMIDGGGNDRYSAPGLDRTMGGFGGAAGEQNPPDTFRPTRPTVGVLVDLGGNDTYTLGETDASAARQNTTTLWPAAADGALLILP
jgi:hypothetical protein